MEESVAGSFGSAIELYAREQGIADVVGLPVVRQGLVPPGDTLVALAPTVEATTAVKALGPTVAEIAAPVAFGYRFLESPGSISYFANTKPKVERVGPPWQFGFASVLASEPQYQLYEVVR